MSPPLLALVAVLAVPGAPGRPPTDAAPVGDLDGLVAAALARSPGLAQIRARIAAARARVPQVRAWPDPTLTVMGANLPLQPVMGGGSPMTGLEVMAMQMLPYRTQLRLAARMAEERAAAVGEELAEARIMLALMVRTMALELIVHRSMAEVLTRQARVLDRVVELANARLRVQQADLAEVLIARQARAQVDTEVEKVAAERESMEARVNALVSRPQTAAVPSVALPAVPDAVPALADLVARAERQRPMLREMERRRRMEALGADMARTERWPMFSVSLGYRFARENMGDGVRSMSYLTVGLGLRLPVWSGGKTRAQIREADAMASMERHGREAGRIEVERQVRTARDALVRLAGRIALVEGKLLPLSRQALEATLAAYAIGRIAFSMLMDQRRMLYELEVEALRLRVQRAQAWVALGAAVGDDPLPDGRRP